MCAWCSPSRGIGSRQEMVTWLSMFCGQRGTPLSPAATGEWIVQFVARIRTWTARHPFCAEHGCRWQRQCRRGHRHHLQPPGLQPHSMSPSFFLFSERRHLFVQEVDRALFREEEEEEPEAFGFSSASVLAPLRANASARMLPSESAWPKTCRSVTRGPNAASFS